MSKLQWSLATGAALAFAAAAGLPGFAQSGHTVAHDMSPRAFKMNSPLSGSVLMARGIRAGLVTYKGREGAATRRHLLPASAIPNVQASGGNGFSVANETPILVDPANAKNLISGANDYNCGTIQGFYFSIDGGVTWKATCFPLGPNASAGDGDPIIGYAPVKGGASLVYAGGIQESGGDGQIVVAQWDPVGSTWQTPVVAAGVVGTFMDKPWLEIDTNNVVKTRRGNFHPMYVSMTQFDDATNNTIIGVSHSYDGGHTWHLVNVDTTQAFPNLDQFSDLAVGTDGTVYASWMRCTANGPTGDCGGTVASIWTSKSIDHGVTWSRAVKVHSVNLVADSCACTFYGALPNTLERLNDLPVIAVDNSATSTNGRLYIADTNYDRKAHIIRVQVTTSVDGGATWSTPVRVTPAKDKAFNDQFFPWLNVSDGGVLGVTWMDRRNDPANVNYEEFGTTSSSGGSSFNPNLKLADTPSDPWQDGFGGYFIGDYTGNSWTHDTSPKLYAIWTDTRTLEDQAEVGGLIP